MDVFGKTFELIKHYRNWPLLVKDYLKLISNGKDYIVKMRNGTQLKIRSNTLDKGIIKEIFILKVYNNHDKMQINDSDIVVDIGAHIGIFSNYVASINRSGKIFSFEPNPENFQYLEENIRINNFDNVNIFNMGIAKFSGKAKLFLSNATTGSHSLVRETDKFVEISTISVNSLFEHCGIERCDFLKIDTEGSEYEILFNMDKKHLGNVSRIAIEYHDHPDYNVHDLGEFLKQNNFEVEFLPNSMILYAYK